MIGRRTGRNAPIRHLVYIAGFLGIGLLVYLVVETGAEEVVGAIALIGWGLAAVVAYRLVPLLASALSWREMLPRSRRPGFATLAWVRWIREGINNLLPVGQLGGDLVAARLVSQRGTPGAYALGSSFVDITVGVLTQLVFLALGLALLLYYSSDVAVLSLAWTAMAGMAVMAACITVFFLFQQKGMMRLGARLAGGLLKEGRARRLVDRAEETDAAIRDIYRSGPPFARAVVWRFAAWLLGTGEIWLILHFMGKPVGIGEAMVLESFGMAVKSAAFLVPGGIGVVEASLVVFGGLFGLSATDSLAMALSKRVRELVTGVPGLVVWQLVEARRLIRER